MRNKAAIHPASHKEKNSWLVGLAGFGYSLSDMMAYVYNGMDE